MFLLHLHQVHALLHNVPAMRVNVRQGETHQLESSHHQAHTLLHNVPTVRVNVRQGETHHNLQVNALSNLIEDRLNAFLAGPSNLARPPSPPPIRREQAPAQHNAVQDRAPCMSSKAVSGRFLIFVTGSRRHQRNGLIGVARQPYQDPLAQHDLMQMDVECVHCRALHWVDEKLASSSKDSPKFGTCCNHGRIRLAPLLAPPQPLLSFFVDLDIRAKEFRENIRLYNSALSFTSLGVKPDHSLNNGGGPYVFRVHGVLYHLSGSLLPAHSEPPIYAQLYIHDPRAALSARMDRNPSCRIDTMEALQNMLSATHRYAT